MWTPIFTCIKFFIFIVATYYDEKEKDEDDEYDWSSEEDIEEYFSSREDFEDDGDLGEDIEDEENFEEDLGDKFDIFILILSFLKNVIKF